MEQGDSEWISFSDIMTALMLVFLLISILMIHQVESKYKDPLIEFVNIKEDLYQDLKKAFQAKEDDLDIVIGKDLSIKFREIETLFDQDSFILKNTFKTKLDIFLPIYFYVINKDKYKDDIKELRIEGHTAGYSPLHNTNLQLVKLSQARSNAIFQYILDSEYYISLNNGDKNKLFFWLSSNGFGKGRAIDDNSFFVYNSKQDISMNSRRIEFKLITNSGELIEEILGVQ